jgi:hypothetical protein
MINTRIKIVIWTFCLLNSGCLNHTKTAIKTVPESILDESGLKRLYPDMNKKELLQMLGKPAAIWYNTKQTQVKIWEYLLVVENDKFKRWADPDELKAPAITLENTPIRTKLETPKDREDIRKYYEIKLRLDAFLAANHDNLEKLSLGMTKKDVLDTMGFDTLELGSALIPNPYRIEVADGKELVYYFSRIVKPDDTISTDNLTALVFYQGKLVSTVYDPPKGLNNPKK